MDAGARAFWVRLTKSAAFLALGAAAHVWLLPSTRPVAVTDELATIAEPNGLVPQPAQPRGVGVIALLDNTSDDLAGASPHSPLAAPPAFEPEPVGTSGHVIAAVHRVDARPILDHPRTEPTPVQPLPAPPAERISRPAETAVIATPQTAELQLASEALSPIRDEALALARPTATSDTPHPAVNVRQLVDEEQMVRRVLQQYRTAYEQLDAAAAKSVWPTVDERALTHAFQQLAGQRVTFRSCGISISGTGANARCRGEAEYFPKIGVKRAYTTSGEWVFDLAREQTSWRIVNATVQ